MPCIWSISFISYSLFTDVLDISSRLPVLSMESSVSSSFDIVKFGAKISVSAVNFSKIVKSHLVALKHISCHSRAAGRHVLDCSACFRWF